MPQDRERARTDPNCVPCPPRTPKPPRVYPPAGPGIYDTHDALFHLADTLLRHGTTVEGNVGQGVGTSKAGPSGARPSHPGDSHTRSPDYTRGTDHTSDAQGLEIHVIPHPCTACSSICSGPTSNFWGNGLLQFVSKTHSLHSRFCFISQFSIVS